MRVYYNEFDAKAAAWLRELIKAGLIPEGDIDERSIADVSGDDLSGYQQCHFFAGIGGWARALELAGWEGPVWTGSCPCQPFSAAGAQSGRADTRDLWPEFWRLISHCSPDRVFGEQVAGSIGFGWIDRVRSDVETKGYALGIAVLGAHTVGAPHIRQRLFWVANGAADGRRQERTHAQRSVEGDSEEGRPAGSGLRGASRFWDRYELIPCLDGKARRIEPGSFPLAHGISARMVRLRGYGNAIVPQVAAEFIAAFMEIA